MAYSQRFQTTGITTRVLMKPNYQLVRQIAVGGMAEVYLARTNGMAGFYRYVAIKWLRSCFAGDPEFVGMLIDEALIASNLHHAGISAILDLGFCDGRYYIVEEYVHGRDLRHILQRCSNSRRPPSIALACYIIMKLCDALDYAHEVTDGLGRSLEIVHRDVSPPNVILSYEGSIKLIDFGIARSCNRSTTTQIGYIKGKLSYMSPEQLQGHPVDRRTDVFALGVLLYELINIKPLFGGSDRALMGEEDLVSRLRDFSGDDALHGIISKALAWEPTFRYQSAAELREALSAYSYQKGHRTSRAELSRWLQEHFQGSPDIHDPMALRPMEVYAPTRRLRAWERLPHTQVLR